MALEQAGPIKLCKCGCGKEVKKVTQHYYLRHKPKVLLDKCECGCGEKPKPGKRFKKGHGRREKFLPLEEAKEVIRSLNFKSQKEYWTLRKEGKLSNGLPHSPDIHYRGKGWNNWYDYLGKYEPVEPLSFEEARNVMRKLGLKNSNEFQKLKRHKGTLPKGIPARPDTEYINKGWMGYPDFLGYKCNRAERKFQLPFEEVKRLVRVLKIPSSNTFVKLKQQGKLPRGVPVAPDQVYKNKGWISWPDFLGNYYRALPFEEARNIVRGFKCKGIDDYSKLYKQGKLPRGIPYNPADVYGNKGWMGYPDFLGYEYDQIQRGSALPYNEVKKILTPLKLSSQKEFLELHKQGNLPNGIPRSPKTVYKNKGWNNWSDFLGYEPKPKILLFKEARRIARTLNIRGDSYYYELYRQGKLPEGLPASPGQAYKDKGWKGLPDFLGYSYPKPLPYEEVKRIVRSLGVRSRAQYERLKKQGKLPEGIPLYPNKTYKDKGWVDWEDFTGFRPVICRLLPFDQAEKIAKSLGCKTSAEYKRLHRQGKLPKGMPLEPLDYRYDKRWRGTHNFLGCKPFFTPLLSFEEADKIAKTLNIKKKKEYKELFRQGKLPKGSVASPHKSYKNEGWISWYEFLGSGKVKPLPFEKAREMARKLGCKKPTDYVELYKQRKLPKGLTIGPEQTYKDKGWISWSDFLGYEPKPKILLFKEARRIARSLGCKRSIEYTILYRQGNLPKGMPFNPHAVYRKK